MDYDKDLVSCKLCEKKFEDIPINFPCGHLVCKQHLDTEKSSKKSILCFICQDHEINIEECLNLPSNKHKIKQNHLKEKFTELNKKIETFKLIKKEPKRFIEESFKSIIQKVNEKREKLKFVLCKQIDEYYDELIEKLCNDQKDIQMTLAEEISLIERKSTQISETTINQVQEDRELSISNKISLIDCKIREIELSLSNFKNIDKIVNKGYNYHLEVKQENFDIKNVYGTLAILDDKEPNTSSTKSFDLNNYTCLKTIYEKAYCVKLMENNQFISGSENGEIKIWDMNTEKCLKKFKAHNNSISSLQFLPNGNLISTSFDSSFKIWNLETGKCLKTLNGHTDVINCLFINKYGEIFTGSRDKIIKVWNLNSGECIKTINAHTDAVNELLLLNDSLFVSCSRDKTIKIWDIICYKCIKTITGHKDSITCLLIFEPNKIVSGSRDLDIKTWDIFSGKCTKIFRGHSEWVICLAKLDYNLLVSGSGDKTFKIWNYETEECLKTFKGHTFSVHSIQITEKKR